MSDGVRLSATSRGYLGDGNEVRSGNPGDTIIKLNNDLHYKLLGLLALAVCLCGSKSVCDFSIVRFVKKSYSSGNT